VVGVVLFRASLRENGKGRIDQNQLPARASNGFPGLPQGKPGTLRGFPILVFW
jgi:hypothetical protein